MAAAGAESGDGFSASIHPSAWLVVSTLALLLGQAVAVMPWAVPEQTGFLLILPLLLLASTRWRGFAILFLLASLAW